jgi:uncharacterized membrane protein YkgB
MTSRAIAGSGTLPVGVGGQALGGALERGASLALRYGLVLVLVWIGAMKFTTVEAKAIEGFVANSPLSSWIYAVLGVEATAALIGGAELAIAGLIAVRPLSARLAVAGSALAAGMFLTTLSFMVSTPGVFEASLGGFPALSVLPGQFLLKDVVLLAAALWSLAEAWNARIREHAAVGHSEKRRPEPVYSR